jgi:hypothetical protein
VRKWPALYAERFPYVQRAIEDEADEATADASMPRDPVELEERMTAEFLADEEAEERAGRKGSRITRMSPLGRTPKGGPRVHRPAIELRSPMDYRRDAPAETVLGRGAQRSEAVRRSARSQECRTS